MATTYHVPDRVVTEFGDRNLGRVRLVFEAGEHAPVNHAEEAALQRLVARDLAEPVEPVDDPDPEPVDDPDPADTEEGDEQ